MARFGLLPPPASAGPQETLRWVRRVEIVFGVVSIVFGLTDSGLGWLRWVLVGLGLLGLSPWPGAAAILRRAERRPEVLEHDRARGAARARRLTLILVPVYTLAAAVIGYFVDGWPAALFMGGLIGLSGTLGAVLAIRRSRR